MNRPKKARFWTICGTIGGFVIAGGGAIYAYAHSEARKDAVLEAHGVRMNTQDEKFSAHLKAFEAHVDAFQAHVKAFEVKMDEQRKVNEAIKLQNVRNEVILETVARRVGARAPAKPPAQRRAEIAVGIDPDDPMGNWR